MLHSDLSLTTCLRILEDVNSGDLSFDRTLKVNAMVDNCKDNIMEQFPRSSKSLKTLLQKNREDFLRSKQKRVSEKEKIAVAPVNQEPKKKGHRPA